MIPTKYTTTTGRCHPWRRRRRISSNMLPFQNKTIIPIGLIIHLRSILVIFATVILSIQQLTTWINVVTSFHLQPPLRVLSLVSLIPIRRSNHHHVVSSPHILFGGFTMNNDVVQNEMVNESSMIAPTSSRSSMIDHSMNCHRRRHLIRNGIIAAMLIINPMVNTNHMAHAKTSSSSSSSGYVRGAAELDLEYYIRDLLGNQNEKIGNIQPSIPPPIKPPRMILNPLLDLLLNDAFTYSSDDITTDIHHPNGSDDTGCCCCTIRALIDTIRKQQSEFVNRTLTTTTSTTTTVPIILITEIQASIMQYRDRVIKSFYQRAAWDHTTVSDQYYFDMISYTIWKTAGNYLPSSQQKSQFVSTLGQYIYQSLVQQQLISIVPLSNDTQHPLTSTNQYVREILNLFTKCGFIQSYRIGGGTGSSSSSATTTATTTTTTTSATNDNLFDTYDDEAFLNQSSIDVLISIYESATLGASLQFTGEQSRFLPDYIGPTLMAMWYNTIQQLTTTTTISPSKLSITYETYFLDSTYRPNPKDYFPDEQIYQFTIAIR